MFSLSWMIHYFSGVCGWGKLGEKFEDKVHLSPPEAEVGAELGKIVKQRVETRYPDLHLSTILSVKGVYSSMGKNHQNQL